jgi:hypothetical protein
MSCTPFPFNATRQIPNPYPLPCPWPVQQWNPNSVEWQIRPDGLPANVPNNNPGSPNPQKGQGGYPN